MNLDGVKDMLHDYFSMVLPDNYLMDIINSDEYLLEYVIDEAYADTGFRDSLADTIAKSIGISVDTPDMFGEVGSHSWPRYGDSNEYEKSFFSQLKEKIIKVGGDLV